MKLSLPFELRVPLLYVNPPVNADAALVEEVSRAGGLGIVDHVTSGPTDWKVAPDAPHGVRVLAKDLDAFTSRAGVVMALIPLEDANSISSLEPGALKDRSVPVFVEVDGAKQAREAEAAGAAGLVARGNEGPGWVSETCGFVLLQELLRVASIPVFLQGGIGLRTAAGAISAGAAGVALDVHLLLTNNSGAPQSLQKFLRGLGFPSTVVLAEATGSPLRIYSRVGTRAVRELRKLEESIAPQDYESYLDRLRKTLANPGAAPDSDEMLLPLSEGISAAKKLAEQFSSATEIVAEFGKWMSPRKHAWPFSEDSALASEHGTRFPIVQGPMAHVSDNPDFLGSMVQAGALPFMAMGNMPEGIAREGLALAREKTQGNFGVGLIGLEVNRACYERHLEIMKQDPPRFAILAAGSVDLAQQIENMGIGCYLHCPAPSLLSEALKAGLRRFVFEGCESGGHIGTLGSLDLWNANLSELEAACGNGLSLQEVRALFAGGIASPIAAAFLAGMVGDLASKGLRVGLQMGTAYLATKEAVSSCAITSTYQKLTLDSDRTAVIGSTVNTRARAAGSPMAAALIRNELERLRTGVPLRERKELYEKDNLGALRLASKGCAIDPETATWDCPVFCDLPSEEQLERGLYLMGQVVSLLDSPLTAQQLHEEIIEQGRRIFESQADVAESEPELLKPDMAEPALEMEYREEPIAVIGIGLRFPGSDSPEAFWDQIVSGRSGIRDVPTERWGDPNFYYDPDPKAPDKTYSRIGGFITDFEFDPLKYRIPPSVAKQMDRTQQMAIACVGEALADAGLSPEKLKDRKVGIILGNSMGGESTDAFAQRVNLPKSLAHLDQSLAALDLDAATKESLIESFRSRYLADLPDITEDSLPGELANVISGRVANVFNLEGPNFTVDAACASSMAAVMNAAAALKDGRIDYAVTGGVDASMHPSSFVKFCKIGALSPDGSRPFDEAANGFVMGEGAGIMILKRLSAALRDGDRIYGTIIGIGSSSDGRGKGITAPNEVGQVRAIRNCLEDYSIDLNSIGLIEAHGTSTSVGDKTELVVLDRIFKEAGMAVDSVAIGSVKSQIGHLKAAAGSAGLIKVLLSLHNRMLPPTINVNQPNRCIDWDSSPLFLSAKPHPWKTKNGEPRRAGVSAFGFGGTNFHIMLQEHLPGVAYIQPKQTKTASISETTIAFPRPNWPRPPEMQLEAQAWVIGANDPGDLAAKTDAILRDLTPANAAQLAYLHREESLEFDIRCGFSAPTPDATVEKLAMVKNSSSDPAKLRLLKARGIYVTQGASDKAKAGVAFLFPGQGSQYPFMLRDLAERFPIVAHTLQEADEILRSLGLAAVTEAIYPAIEEGAVAEADSLKDTQRLQPMILTANTAIFRLLSQMGVAPAACAGHSLGEYAACVAAGVFSFRDALEAVAVRGREMARVSIADPGLMMSIPADARVVEEALAEVDGYVVAANKNSPKQTVISGETAAVKKAAELFKARGLDGILLPVSAAFHSGVVAPAREPFMKTLEKLAVNPPSVPVLSNVTGDFYPVGPAAPARIRDLLGKQFAAPVEWVKTLRRLYSEGIRIFLECGPKRVLTNLTQDTLPADALALPTNHPKKGGMVQLMETLAALVAEGVSVNFAAAEGFPEVVKEPRRQRPELKIVKRPVPVDRYDTTPASAQPAGPLDGLLDDEIRRIASQKEFARFIEIQGEPVRALIKSGFQTFVTNVLPLEKTAALVKSEGMDFAPVVVSGIAAGLPSDVRFPFDRETLDELIQGQNYIKKVRPETRQSMLEKNVERLVKGPSGEVETQVVDDISGVIKLAGFFSEDDIIEQYGFEERVVRAMDITTRLAVAAGLEALRDAGIPLVRLTRTTTTGGELPDSWALPPDLRSETGVIFASAFPGMSSLVDEVTRQTAARYGPGAKKRLIDFYTGLVGRIHDDKERERITGWFSEEFSRLNPAESDDLYTFNRDFLLKVIGVAHGQLAQFIKAQGPATHVDAACAGTTQAILVARDWIRTGQAKRVIVIAADDAAGKSLFPWIGTGFLALGAATTSGNVGEAALPFDDRRHGLIIGSAAAGMVLESQELVKKRGMEPIAAIETGVIANSGYHGTRLDVEHISSVLQGMMTKWETQSGLSRDQLAQDVFFMSHETYSPKRGGSSAAEVRALRDTFGEKATLIPIANTKGFTGHTMGAGVEDVVALRCLQKRTLPPIPNLKQPDPEFSDLNLSRGGPCAANYALRLAAGFGSQIVVALYKAVSREENRIVDLATHRNWLKSITGYSDPVVSVEDRTLKVSERVAAQKPARKESAAQTLAVGEVNVAASVATAGGSQEVREKILDLLAEKTGYPAEMLDTGLDLEADLGIDTVKQAEFISEVREAFDIPRIEGLKIADFPTIEHIINFVLQHVGGFGQDVASQEVSAALGTGPTGDQGQVRDKILSLLSEKTGYPADMLDTGLDLEADLGIDTVKQAEFISEIREAFNIPRIEGLKIADFPTINHIISFVIERTSLGDQTAASPADDKKTVALPVAEADVRLLEARLLCLPPLEAASLPEVDEVIIAGGPADIVKKTQTALKSAGYSSIVKVADPEIPKASAEKRIGVINLFPMEDDMSPKKTFELCLSLAHTFEKGPVFFVSAASEDGAYGFENPTADGYKAGIVAGATKSFGRECPDAVVHMLDLHPNLTPADKAGFIVRSLHDSFPLETAVGADGKLAAIRLVPHVDEIPEPGTRPGDVVLASGGAGGITAACIRRLAEQHPLTFVILDRTSLSKRSEELAAFGPEQWEAEKQRIVERMKREGSAPTPVMVERELGALKAEADAFRNIRELKALGSEVIFRSVDIRDREAVDRAIKEAGEICRRIDVVIHAAGIDISRALKSKSIEQIENVVSVKVDGMLAILEALKRRDLPPRRIVGFGSVAGRFGNLAQIDYSAANDGLAHMLRWADKELDAKASIIDWAPWSQIGMATRGSVQLTLEAAGIDFVAPQQGIEFLFQELGRTSAPQEMMAAGRMGPFNPDAFELPGSQEVTEAVFAGQQASIATMIPGEYIRAKVQLDPSHPLLNDHRIDRAAVLPGVGGLEIMRCAAALLNPEARDSNFEQVRFRSPLKIFEKEPFEAEVEVARSRGVADQAAVYDCKIISWFVDNQGRKMGSPRLHHQCRLVTGKVEKAKPADFETWAEQVRIVDRDIYSVFFHGPAFRFLDHVTAEASGKSIRFRYADSDERAAMFTSPVPAAIEAAFQAAAALGMESRGMMALPTGVGRATIYSWDSLPWDGELVARDQGTLDGPEERAVLTFDGVIRDREGNTIIRLENVEMIELEAAKGFSARIFESFQSVAEVVKHLEKRPKAFLKENLDKDEVKEHSTKTVPKRAHEWLAGRVAMKRTVQRALASNGDKAPDRNTIRIVQDDLGNPSAEVAGKSEDRLNEISLSHSNGLAFAAASVPGAFQGLGVDIEKVEKRKKAWINGYFTPEEISSAGDNHNQWVRLTMLWSLKEAFVKAVGTGLRFDLRDIRVNLPADSGLAQINFLNEAAERLDTIEPDKIDARVEERGEYVVARVMIRK